MQNIKSVQALGLKCLNHKEPVSIGRKTILSGPNGTGKTAHVQAIQLALTGAVPGINKKGVAIMDLAAGDEMAIYAVIESGTDLEVSLSRKWTRNPKTGGVKQVVEVNGVKAPAAGADAMINLAIGEPVSVWDSQSFWSQSPAAIQRDLLARLDQDGTLAEAIEAAKTAKEDLNQLRVELKAKQGTTKTLQEQLNRFGPQQDLGRLKEQIAEKRELVQELQKVHQHGLENDAAREQAQKATQDLEDIQNELQDLAKEDQESKKARKSLEKERKAASQVLEEIHVSDLPAEARKAVSDIVEHIGTIKWPKSVIEQAEAIAESLSKLIPSEKELREKKATLSAAYEAFNSLQNQVDSHIIAEKSRARKIEKLKERHRLAKVAEARLDKIGPGSNPDDSKVIEEHRQALDEMQAWLESSAEIEGVKHSLDLARADVEKVMESEEQAKQRVSELNSKLDVLATKCTERLALPMSKVLPFGGLFVDWGTMSLCWDLGEKIVPAAGLSGSQRAIFDAALGRGLCGDAGLVIVEASELDEASTKRFMQHLENVDQAGQYILCHWNDQDVPEGWKQIKTS